MKKLLPLLLLILIGCSKNGVYETYYENGRLKEVGTYKDGKEDGLWKFYGRWNGRLKQEGIIKDGEEEGLHKFYNDNGQLGTEVSYKDGELDGPLKSYAKNERLWFEGTFKDGRRDGDGDRIKFGNSLDSPWWVWPFQSPANKRGCRKFDPLL